MNNYCIHNADGVVVNGVNTFHIIIISQKKRTLNMGSLALRMKMICDNNNVEVEISGSGFSSIQERETTEIKFFQTNILKWHPYANNLHIVGLSQLMVVFIIRELVPESQAYMDLLAFERKLDQTIMRKRVDIQEALKRPMKQKRKLRLYISNTFNPAKPDAEDSEGSIASWELRVEGKLLDDPGKQKRKFSSFFKSLVIELDKDLYGPDNHLVEWHRTATSQETDGFQVKRPGDVNVRCTLLLMLDYQPSQFKLDPRLARLLGIHTQTRSCIIQALWQYVKTNKLQDSHEKEYINCDKYFQQIFDGPRLKFSEIPQRLTNLLLPPDPIVINHVISVDPNDQKKTACYDIDVEVDDPLKSQMNGFLLSTANHQEIASLDNKIHETIESINQLKIQRDFMLSFSRDPKGYIQDWICSQNRDLKLMTDTVGNPEEERRAEFYNQPWSQEAVSRYFYCKIQQRRQELEQALAMRTT
uniref:SWI/SNF related, matrix associated, actin dependent regulator of chromatin, subfamily d, member 3a n=1 Tax=Cyprinus carpio TaxID=7962 RepID=A0A8C1RJP7_CYPCA